MAQQKVEQQKMDTIVKALLEKGSYKLWGGMSTVANELEKYVEPVVRHQELASGTVTVTRGGQEISPGFLVDYIKFEFERKASAASEDS